jgi:hypothetical protein
MKSLMSLWSEMANDAAISCRTSAISDINTVRKRVEHEGISFLTISLPELGKATQKWLDQGKVEINPHFPPKRRKRGEVTPYFLGGFFSRVFDRSTGVLLENPCIASIRAIRQLTLSFGKIALPCSEERDRAAMQGYIECEQDVRQTDSLLSESDLAEFLGVSDLLYRELFTQMDRDVYYGQILPKHGPGSVADGLTSNGKYRLRTWTSRLEEVFPSYEYLIPNLHFREELEEVDILEPDSEMPVKVITVPKTLKTPRIIAIEPACMQYTQQGLLRCFLSAHRRDNLLRELIGFDDQGPNQALARQGSTDGQTATLDLSDASDRVSNQLVMSMVRHWPHLKRALDATRSRRAEVPGHGIIRLAKYASMGSALCFPVEAMVFTALVFLGIQRSLNTTLSKKDMESFKGSVRVYGDDLIVPTDHVHMIVQTIDLFGGRVGEDKSFWTGRFRESCGKEYYAGHDVGIVRVRNVPPTTITDATGVISAVSLRNQLYEFGYWRTSGWLDNLLSKMLKHFPIVGPASPVLGRVSYDQVQDIGRMHPSLHSPQVRGYTVQAKAPNDELGGTGALLKCLLKLEYGNRKGYVDSHIDSIPCYRSGMTTSEEKLSSPWTSPPMGQDAKHLERSGRPKRVGIKLGWSSI